jgi:hypothetical protein
MKKELLYHYLGTNGTITSPVHLEDVYYVRKLKLTADKGKVLTDGEKTFLSVLIAEEDLPLWKEVSK